MDVDIANVMGALNRVQQELAKLDRTIHLSTEAFASIKIPASLRVFDNWFKYFLKSQNLRWLLVDLVVPVLLGGYAILVLTSEVF